MSVFLNLRKNEEGATAIEYALIVGLVAIAIVVATTGVGTQLGLVLSTVSNYLSTANDGLAVS